MKLLRKDVDYAVRALICVTLAGGEPVSSSDIAASQKIPLRYLRRLLTRLRSAGFLTAREGAGGGVTLAVSPRRITLVKLAEIFQDGLELSDCLYRGKPCENRAGCPLRRRLKKAEAELTASLSKVTIAALAADLTAAPKAR